MTAMPKRTAAESDARFAREGKTPSQSPPSKPTRRKQNEALVDATQLLDRPAEVTSEAERTRVRLDNERAKTASLETALEREQSLRKRAEGALDQAKAASAELSSQLEAERAARKQAEVDLARVDEKSGDPRAAGQPDLEPAQGERGGAAAGRPGAALVARRQLTAQLRSSSAPSS
jgi:hypothetical protein